MNLEKYNENITHELSTTQLVGEEDLMLLNNNMNIIGKSLKHSQIFRTDTEARVSVLNNVKHPTPDSKYWQSMRELKVQSSELFNLNFEYKEKVIDKKELEKKLNEEYDNDFDKQRDEIKLEKLKYELLQMELTAKDRIREVNMWGNIIKELEPVMDNSKTDVNEHQLISYGARFINEYVAAIKSNAQSSPSEARNMMGLLTTTLDKIKKEGKMDLLAKQAPPETLQFLTENKLLE